jgi:CRP/FNR family cyclic AMP-dependent transcriptional regulator
MGAGLAISAERLREIAFWSHGLTPEAFERTRAAVTEKVYGKGAYICHRGDRLDAWCGVVSGLIKMGSVSRGGKAVAFAGLTTGMWFGEGSVLKDEPRQYDLVALRETRLAFLNKATFYWLFETSVAFNRFLVRQFNERIGQFIAMVEQDRMLEADARVARAIAWLLNPTLNPTAGAKIDINQEELGQLAGLSRQAANRALKVLEGAKLIQAQPDGLHALDLKKLRNYGD